MSVHDKEALVQPLLDVAGSRLALLLVESTDSEVVSKMISCLPTHITSWLQNQVTPYLLHSASVSRIGFTHCLMMADELLLKSSPYKYQRLSTISSIYYVKYSVKTTLINSNVSKNLYSLPADEINIKGLS